MAELSKDFARYAGLGIQFALTIVFLGALGWWLDSMFGTRPWMLVVGVLAGGALAFVSLLRSVPRASGRRTELPPDKRHA